MDAIVRSNITRLLGESVDAISKGDSFKLKELSNGNIHNASIFQDEDSLSVSVVIYALSKVIERTANAEGIASRLKKAIDAISSGNDAAYRSEISQLIKAIRLE